MLLIQNQAMEIINGGNEANALLFRKGAPRRMSVIDWPQSSVFL